MLPAPFRCKWILLKQSFYFRIAYVLCSARFLDLLSASPFRIEKSSIFPLNKKEIMW